MVDYETDALPTELQGHSDDKRKFFDSYSFFILICTTLSIDDDTGTISQVVEETTR